MFTAGLEIAGLSRVRPTAFALAACAATALTACGSTARADSDEEPEHARMTLIAETDAAVPGATLWLALDFVIDDEWHIYWPGHNDSGFAPQWTLSLPEGWTEG